MAFRDDRDALRAKNESLEGEVGELQQKLNEAENALSTHEAKDHEDEDELARLRDEVGKLKKRLGLTDEEEIRAARMKPILVAAGIIAVSVGVAGYLALSTDEKIEPPPTPAPELPVLPPELEDLELEPSKHGLDVAYFGAVVVEVGEDGEDVAAEVGDGCVLEVELDRLTGRARLYCRGLLADVPVEGGTLWASNDVTALGEVAARIEGLSASGAVLSVDSLRHELMLRDGEGTTLARLYVQDFSMPIVGAAVPPTDAPPTDVEPVDAELAAHHQTLVDDATCDLDGDFDGRLRTPDQDLDGVTLGPTSGVARTVTVNGRVVEQSREGLGDSTLVTPFGGSSQPTREVDCEAGTATLTSDEMTLTGRFGPAFATFMGRYDREGDVGIFWMRRMGADEARTTLVIDVDDQPSLDSLPPEVREAVQQALDEALEGVR